jgi:hypothetical protein
LAVPFTLLYRCISTVISVLNSETMFPRYIKAVTCSIIEVKFSLQKVDAITIEDYLSNSLSVM